MTLQNLTNMSVLYVPLTPLALDNAEILALEQANPVKRQQVYLKTLSIYGVADWINYELEGDFTAHIPGGDFYDPLLRATLDTADLEIIALGRVECRPILDDATSFTLPLETLTDRIAYIAVRIPEELYEVELLGFLPSDYVQVHSNNDDLVVQIADLKSMDEFPLFLAAFSLLQRAIFLVEEYLSDRGIITDRDASLNLPGKRTPACLVLSGIGPIECLVVSDQEIPIPKLEWNDRVAFVIVEVAADRGEILGFLSAFLPGAFIPDAMPLDDPARKPVADLVPYLQAIQAIDRVFAENSEESVFREMEEQMSPGYTLKTIAPCLVEISNLETIFQRIDMERWVTEIIDKSPDRMRDLVLRTLKNKGEVTDPTDEEIEQSFSDLVTRFIDRFFGLQSEIMKNTDR